VVVRVELEIKKEVTERAAQSQKQEEKSRFAEQDFILPGLPNQKSVTADNRPKEGSSERSAAQETKFNYTFAVKSRMITVIYDAAIKDALRDLVKTTIQEAFKITPQDKLEFKKARFVRGYLNELLRPMILVPVLFGILLLLFLFGPLAGFFRSLVRTMKEKGGTEVSVDSKFENAPDEDEEAKDGKGGGGGGGGGPLTPEEQAALDAEEKKYRPFRYVTEENLKRLVYLLRKEPPKTIALVISYLKQELVKEILCMIPPELQTQVAVSMATIRQMTKNQVMQIDTEIKEKIDFLVGGLDSLLKVLDDVDMETKNNIMNYLEQEKPELHEMVKKSILSFEDIPVFPDPALQIIVRELKTESLARALRNAPQDIIQKFVSNMSSGAAALLKEEMEYGRPLTPEQIDDERKKILDTIKILERDNKIVVREHDKHTLLQGEEEIAESDWEGIAGSALSAHAAAGSPTQNVYDYYQAGVQMFEAGNTNEALSYFVYCVQADPSLWQAYQYLGTIYYQTNQLQESLRAFENAIRLNPGNTDIQAWIDNLRQSVH
jgi:flagellar motor switch protein FliG